MARGPRYGDPDNRISGIDGGQVDVVSRNGTVRLSIDFISGEDRLSDITLSLEASRLLAKQLLEVTELAEPHRS